MQSISTKSELLVLCRNGPTCRFMASTGCRYYHPSISVSPHVADCLQIDPKNPHFGSVSNGSVTYDILNCAVSYDGNRISKKIVEDVVRSVNSDDSIALIETSLCFHRELEVYDGVFLKIARIRDSDQASNQEKLLSLYEETKQKFGFIWPKKVGLQTDFRSTKWKSDIALQTSFSSVHDHFNQAKEDFLAKLQAEEEFMSLDKDIQASVGN